jgi:hypothetical protein
MSHGISDTIDAYRKSRQAGPLAAERIGWRCRSCEQLVLNAHGICVVCGTARADEPEEQIPEHCAFATISREGADA